MDPLRTAAFDRLQADYGDNAVAWPDDLEAFLALLPEDWRDLLLPLDGVREALTAVLRTIQEDINNHRLVLPPAPQVFTALWLLPPNDVRVVIVGQDPYKNVGEAHGLAFSVTNGKPPPSLRNIFKVIERDTGRATACANGDLSAWARQGVLLLNAALTLRIHQSRSHLRPEGWLAFTRALLAHLCANADQPLVFMLWGRYAQELVQPLLPPQHPHLVLQSSHPSPLGCRSATPESFMGCRHFSRANAFLPPPAIRW